MGAAVVSGFGLMNVNAAEGDGTEASTLNEVVAEGSTSTSVAETTQVTEAAPAAEVTSSLTEGSTSSAAPKVARTKVVKLKPITRTAAQKKELGLLKCIHRVNINGNIAAETQDPKVILSTIGKHMGKVIHIEERRELNERDFDMDSADINTVDGWLTQDIMLQFNGFKFVGRYPQHLLTEVEECLQIAVEKQQNMQILIKPKSMVK